MPGPQSEYREIGNLDVEATPLLLEIAMRTSDGTIGLKRQQAFELRDFLNRQFPDELGVTNSYQQLQAERDQAREAVKRFHDCGVEHAPVVLRRLTRGRADRHPPLR